MYLFASHSSRLFRVILWLVIITWEFPLPLREEGSIWGYLLLWSFNDFDGYIQIFLRRLFITNISPLVYLVLSNVYLPTY